MYPGNNKCLLNIYNLKIPQSYFGMKPLKVSEYWSNGQYYIPGLRHPIGERQIHCMIRFLNQNGVDATKL